MEDSEAIRRCALDYIEGWYEGSAERMSQALSPHLTKRRFVSEQEIWDIRKDRMVPLRERAGGAWMNRKMGEKKSVFWIERQPWRMLRSYPILL